MRNEAAVLQSEPIFDWIVRNMDVDAPLLVPLVWAMTNLTTSDPNISTCGRPARADISQTRSSTRCSSRSGRNTIVREATPDISIAPSSPRPHSARLRSGEDAGTRRRDERLLRRRRRHNSPIGIAHAVSSAADVVLLDPPFEPDEDTADAVGIAYSIFGTMQRKIFEVEMRNVYFQSLAKRAFSRLRGDQVAIATSGSDMLGKFMQVLPVTDLRYIRPEKVLAVPVAGFDDQKGINEAFSTGWTDLGRGFVPYDWLTFEL